MTSLGVGNPTCIQHGNLCSRLIRAQLIFRRPIFAMGCFKLGLCVRVPGGGWCVKSLFRRRLLSRPPLNIKSTIVLRWPCLQSTRPSFARRNNATNVQPISRQIFLSPKICIASLREEGSKNIRRGLRGTVCNVHKILSSHNIIVDTCTPSGRLVMLCSDSVTCRSLPLSTCEHVHFSWMQAPNVLYTYDFFMSVYFRVSNLAMQGTKVAFIRWLGWVFIPYLEHRWCKCWWGGLHWRHSNPMVV